MVSFHAILILNEGIRKVLDVQILDKIFNGRVTGEVVLVPELSISVRVSLDD